MQKIQDVEIAIIGAGVVGIATAYYLSKKYRRRSIVLIDSREPMSYTSAQSGDNYRNWWPSEVMTQFTNHSIQLMHEFASESANILQMKQGGYVLATRQRDITELLDVLSANYSESEGLIRTHNTSIASQYKQPMSKDWQSQIEGVDILSSKDLISQTFPAFSKGIENVLHIRKAGDFSSQQMGQAMLQQMRPVGVSRIRGRVIELSKDQKYKITIESKDKLISLSAESIVNAAGPYLKGVANMLGADLPVENIFHQKIAFEDHLATVPREQPFAIDLDQTVLDWADEEAFSLREDSSMAWLTKPIDGGIHCRPEGAGRWIKLGWAYNREASAPDNSKQLIEDPQFNPNFPEIVLRGAAKLNPGLQPYIENLPPSRVHYGGYYTMTKENWPLIGPLDGEGAYVVGALSGFGSMSACAAGSLCADWVCQGELPAYAKSLSPDRYNDAELIAEIRAHSNIGLL